MTIDTSGEWWVGDRPTDIAQYLESYASSEGYGISEFRLARCRCGSQSFLLDADIDEGAARRTCTACQSQHFICDSAEYWDDAGATGLRCVCESESINIGIGFSIYPSQDGIRWIYVGVRCTACGVLGCFVDWKVGTSDMGLLDKV